MRTTGRHLGRESFQQEGTYEHAVVFAIDPAALDSALIHPDTLFHGGIVYDGVVPLSSIVKMLKIPITKRLELFAVSVTVPEVLQLYVGKDLNKHLRIKQFDIVDRRFAA